MNPKIRTKKSKRLSLILRHRPQSVGITLDENGWTNVQELLDALKRSGSSYSLDILKAVVVECPKKRFEFNNDETEIRARQGHSIAVDLGYEATTPPDRLYHGTADRFLDSIFAEGLKKQQRHHVHMSTDIDLMMEVGRRHGKAVLLEVNAEEMKRDGHDFFVTDNQVWLTDRVPAKYLTKIDANQRSAEN